jgi:DME family drug/metabolite transporter
MLLGVVAATRQVGQLAAVLHRQPLVFVAVGLSTALVQTGFVFAILTVGVSVATIVALGLAPVLITAIESTRARTVPSASTCVVLVAGLSGLVLVSSSSGRATQSPHPVLGLVVAVVTGAGYALTTLLGRRLAHDTSATAVTAGTTAIGALALLPVGVLGADGSSLTTTDPAAVGALLYLGAATMALAYWLLYAGLRTISGGAAVIATLVEPVAASLLAAVLLGERLGVAGAVGAVLILLAVAELHRAPSPGVPPPG